MSSQIIYKILGSQKKNTTGGWDVMTPLVAPPILDYVS